MAERWTDQKDSYAAGLGVDDVELYFNLEPSQKNPLVIAQKAVTLVYSAARKAIRSVGGTLSQLGSE